MSKKLALVLLVTVLVAAAGNVPKLGTHQFTLFKSTAVNGSVLQPGEYKIVVRGTTAFLTGEDGRTLEAPVRIETVSSKFDNTALTVEVQDGKPVISAIDLGGSKTKLLFAH